MKELAVGTIAGIAITVALLAGIGFASAHLESTKASGYSGYGMACMGLSPEDMDANGDGVCDTCGMETDDCEAMQEYMHGDGDESAYASHEAMHEAMHGSDSMPCHG